MKSAVLPCFPVTRYKSIYWQFYCYRFPTRAYTTSYDDGTAQDVISMRYDAKRRKDFASGGTPSRPGEGGGLWGSRLAPLDGGCPAPNTLPLT